MKPSIPHRSPWQTSTPAALFKPFEGELSADVCIVGAGIAGLLCALELTERGYSVVVLERESLAAGDTGATTAHLTAMLDTRYYALASMHGAEAARSVAASHTLAISYLERLANVYEIDCDFQRVSGFLCAADDAQASTLERERKAASDAGISCELVNRAPLPITRGRALHLPRQAQFDPTRFLRGVAEALLRKGARLHAPVSVESVDAKDQSERVTVRSSDGRIVRAKSVVVATGSPINDVATIHTKQAAYRSYAVAVDMPDTTPALHWDMNDPYHYVRSAKDGTTGRQVLIAGGEDHRVGQDSDNQARFERLEDWLRERIPEAGVIVSQWSGQVFEPADGLAFIGRNPGQERVFVVTGESGNGMTYSAIAAPLIADLVQGIENPLEKIYDPSRKPSSLSALGHFVQENLNTAAQYTDWVAPAEVARLEDIEPGQGAVLRRGLRRLAVYVDDAGAVHQLSATCPHLGGVVTWNPAEKSWDCPCHGSRFDCYGKVLVGPAVQDLKRVDAETA